MTLTLSLKLLLIGALIYPSGFSEVLLRLFGNKRPTYTHQLAGSFGVFLGLLAVLGLLGHANFPLSFDWTYILIGLGAGLGSLMLEGLLVKLFSGGGPVKLMKQSEKGFWITASLALSLAVMEEMVYRGILTYWLMDWGFPIILVGLISAGLYALGHVFAGVQVMLMKFASGGVFFLAWFWSGQNILAPIIAHVLANLIILVLGKGKKNVRKPD